MTFSWFCQGLLLPLQHHLKVVPFSNIFWGIFTLLSTNLYWDFTYLCTVFPPFFVYEGKE